MEILNKSRNQETPEKVHFEVKSNDVKKKPLRMIIIITIMEELIIVCGDSLGKIYARNQSACSIK